MNDDPGRRVAIITGGAGGLGRALAAEMADRGCDLVLADIDAEGLRAAATALRATGAELVSETVDVADPTQVEELINGTQRHFGRIDYLFNNAGINKHCLGRRHLPDAGRRRIRRHQTRCRGALECASS